MSATITIEEFLNRDAESRSVIAQKHTESLRKILNDNSQITDTVFSSLVSKSGVTSLTELRDIFALRNEVMGFIQNPGSLDVQSVVETASQTQQPGFAGVVDSEPEVVVEATPEPKFEPVAPAIAETTTLPEGFGSLGTPQARTPVIKAQPGRSPVLRSSRQVVEEIPAEIITPAPQVVDTVIDEVVSEMPEPPAVTAGSVAAAETDVNAVVRKLAERVRTLTDALQEAHKEIGNLRSELESSEKKSVSLSEDVLSELKDLGIDI